MVDESRLKIGVPGMVLLPARNYRCKVLTENHKIEMPRKGNYYDIDPSFFTKNDGDFNIFDEENGVLYLPSIIKTLFAVNAYPDLKEGQFFSPNYILFDPDTITLVGQLIEIL